MCMDELPQVSLGQFDTAQPMLCPVYDDGHQFQINFWQLMNQNIDSIYASTLKSYYYYYLVDCDFKNFVLLKS